MSEKFRSYFQEELEAVRQEGRQEGRQETLEIIKLIKDNLTNDEIMERTHCSLDDVITLRNAIA